MRPVVLATLIALAACDLPPPRDEAAGDDDLGPVAAECVTADDCVLAASTCCGCPDFAMPDLGWQDGCEVVECPSPDPDPADPQGAGCAPVVAACDRGTCTVACALVACDLTCADGFVMDDAGCLRCACAGAEDPVSECVDDAECVRVPADCCGCARGGADAAAPADEADSRVDQLDCPADPADAACPEIDVCDPTLAPRCVAGRCTLAGPPPASDGLCGAPDLAPCPDGTVCVLNADEGATRAGLGTCRPE